ncbi:MAG: glutathione S-transferase N-terminal domain-containing protein [Desulfobulbaceae bacterium]|uniref:Glutaredoxin n=1 Tax=Desulfofustis glycolicus DSM 9705 TaxID=1121409 RepID=A0A1M5SCT8_9BACT|nr:glutathione S-transferase N-terminal domain-containing protein [Desulfofustis glycolicus]MCB2216146.1 glutathione S-transferase N-terminal domain-containing protein [Desulfobulbaceae bacterium]SHH36432.1 Glutaredoxin [Desulfofustis glycolicus DSM 9705]
MLELYVRDGCPFCRKVLDAARELGLKEGEDYRVIDAAPNTPGRQTVLEIGGKAMVPFLIDGDRSMYESDDIVDYLRQQTHR